MEHKLILGGEQYLPFARSRIKALRATGLTHASQQFEVDGVSVKVRIDGEHEYIRIEGGGVETQMDSGVADVLSIAPLNSATFLPGALRETPNVAAHNAGFVLPTPESELRTKPATTSAGQIVGQLTYDKVFKGAVPVDGGVARSFAPDKVTDSTVTPPTTSYVADDVYLAAKKNLAVLCPASVFTGKCRLFVQALYGSPLYSGKSGSQVLQELPIFESSTSAAPVLWFNLTDTALGDYRVKLSTSAGVHLDSATGKHWLICPSTDTNIYVYPLKSSTACEKLRRFLKSPDLLPAADVLSTEDKEHLEAFILSKSTPQLKGRQVLGGTVGEVYSMGYGWHWNWSGLVADAVINSTISQGGGNVGMVSNHLRLTMSLDDTGKWSVVQSVVESDAHWSVYRVSWTFTEPDYSSYTMSKTTPKTSSVSTCDAPFYAFYIRDVLNVCRVRVTYSAGGSSTYESPGWTATGAGGSEGNTVGLLSGYKETINEGWGYNVSVTVGQTATAPVPYGIATSKTKVEVTNKNLSGFGPGYGSSFISGVRTFYSGYPDELIATTILCKVQDDRMPGNVTYDYIYTETAETRVGSLVIAVPFYDAEACYVHSSSRILSDSTEVKYAYQSNLLGSTFVQKDVAFDINGVSGTLQEFVRYGWDGSTAGAGHTLLSTTSRNYESDTTLTNENFLSTRDIATEASFGPLSVFQDNGSDIVSTAFYSLSNTQTSPNVTAYAGPPNNVSVGMPSSISNPVLVGWI